MDIKSVQKELKTAKLTGRIFTLGNMFINEDIEFSEETYANCYNAYYFLAKKVYDGEISKAEYYDAVDRLWAKGSA